MGQALGVFLLVPIWAIIGVVVFGYFTWLDAGGGTLGKRIVDLQVVDGDGSPASTKATALRTAVLMLPFPVMALVGILLGGLGFFIAVGMMLFWLFVEAVVMFISGGQRLGDKVAGTYVVPE
jgi:uncharacterized RDD family membrane protein YckC